MAYGFNGDRSKLDLSAYAEVVHTHSASDIDYGVLPIEHGGTGQSSLQAIRNAMGLGNTTGALPVANGGTGATTALDALQALGLVILTGSVSSVPSRSVKSANVNAPSGDTNDYAIIAVQQRAYNESQWGYPVPRPELGYAVPYVQWNAPNRFEVFVFNISADPATVYYRLLLLKIA